MGANGAGVNGFVGFYRLVRGWVPGGGTECFAVVVATGFLFGVVSGFFGDATEC